MTLSTSENASCAAGACSAGVVSGINVSSDYDYVANSCAVSCTPLTYAAMTKTYNESHRTPNASDIAALSYCTRAYGGQANIGVYASVTNANRPVVGCSYSVGAVQYSTETVYDTVTPPPGTPSCVTRPQVTTTMFGSSSPGQAFASKAGQMLGTNYFVSGIIHKSSSDANCPILPGQSLGQKYSDLVSLVASLGLSSSVCDSDYGVAFDNVSQWVHRSMKDVYLAPDVSSPNQAVVRVWLLRGNQRISLVEGTDVEITGAKIKILKSDLLEPGDKLIYLAHNK